MMGRAAYQLPWLLNEADAKLFGDPQVERTRQGVIESIMPYVSRELAKGVPLNAMTKHLLGLFNGIPGARAYRRQLSENATKPGAGLGVLRTALAHVRDETAERAAA
jgi:tRNA-dihydrouridine synthase A